eukprot:CAMPEP_0174251320 /NCGR_PEP_ID=MMETSP0439-20130205/1176_1 /TAXON_ID=0 /ORGANISM="Stereomyxa ramosa, Strain Chinc5" /LENGTH=271 /DNA_ID=CAMNT_0015331599 /DNA_START=683 /DNA_END=1498 /DNA_ORIENTATION=-
MEDRRITFTRQAIKEDIDWKASTEPVQQVTTRKGGIEANYQATLHADFANKYLGGGVLYGGCVQEEILFSLKPECMVGMLFCAVMEDNEAIFITGAMQYNSYKGYAKAFTWAGDFEDKAPLDEEGNIITTIVAFDALKVRAKPLHQWRKKNMHRDLKKMYCACLDPMSSPNPGVFATGNWGCGVFGGDLGLKVVQQLMAASQAHREITYHSFGETFFSKSLDEWIELLNSSMQHNCVTVSDLFAILTSAQGKAKKGYNILAEIIQKYPPKV